MAFAVFNIANTGSSIRALGPNVRLLGFGLNKTEADGLASAKAIETRIWPMSRGPTAADGSGIELNWRPISNLCLVDHNAAEEALAAEYASIAGRVEAWNAWREALDADVAAAARDHVLRPVYQVRAEMLLATYKATYPTLETRPEFLEPASPKSPVPGTPRVGPVNQVEQEENRAFGAAIVPKWSRADEIVGQTWALMAIIGDAAYEKAKAEHLETLGRKYFDFLKTYTEQTEDIDAERIWHERMSNESEECDTVLKLFMTMEVAPVHKALEALVEEPMVAFFSASEDPEALNKQAETLAKSAALKHADVAVVRMYAWLALRAAKSHRIKHVCRGSKQASDFFEAMRAATF